MNLYITNYKNFLIFPLIFFSFLASAQKNGILLKNETHQYETFFKDNKRVRVKTIDGEMYKGRMKIIDNYNISIGGEVIPLSSIVQIKHHALLITIFSTTIIIVGTILFVGAMLYAEPIGQAIVGVFSTLIVGTAAVIPLLPSKHPSKKWQYSIVNDFEKIQIENKTTD